VRQRRRQRVKVYSSTGASSRAPTPRLLRSAGFVRTSRMTMLHNHDDASELDGMRHEKAHAHAPWPALSRRARNFLIQSRAGGAHATPAPAPTPQSQRRRVLRLGRAACRASAEPPSRPQLTVTQIMLRAPTLTAAPLRAAPPRRRASLCTSAGGARPARRVAATATALAMVSAAPGVSLRAWAALAAAPQPDGKLMRPWADFLSPEARRWAPAVRLPSKNVR
jgi:hypothetical protein